MTYDENTSTQTPSQCGSRSSWRGKISLFLSILVAIYALSPLGHYGLPEKISYMDDEISPSGKYRIEYYEPKHCPYADIFYDVPYFIKIYNTDLEQYVYTSDLDELDERFNYNHTSWPETSNYLCISHGICFISKEELQQSISIF